MQRCTKCGLEKDLSGFYVFRVKGVPRRESRCKECAKAVSRAWARKFPEEAKRHYQESHWKRTYGITRELYDQLLANQNGICAICGSGSGGRNLFDVDHDHETNEIRGLLCHNCNVGLGGFKDSTVILALAYRYLKKHNLETKGGDV